MTSADSKNAGVEMHRLASDRSWPCRVIDWDNSCRFLGVGVGNIYLLQVDGLAALIEILEWVRVSDEFSARCRHPAKP